MKRGDLVRYEGKKGAGSLPAVIVEVYDAEIGDVLLHVSQPPKDFFVRSQLSGDVLAGSGRWTPDSAGGAVLGVGAARLLAEEIKLGDSNSQPFVVPTDDTSTPIHVRLPADFTAGESLLIEWVLTGTYVPEGTDPADMTYGIGVSLDDGVTWWVLNETIGEMPLYAAPELQRRQTTGRVVYTPEGFTAPPIVVFIAYTTVPAGDPGPYISLESDEDAPSLVVTRLAPGAVFQAAEPTLTTLEVVPAPALP